MPLQHPEWIPDKGIVWDGDLGLGLQRSFNYSTNGVLWDELATIDIDSQMSLVNLPRYTHKIAIAYYHASQNIRDLQFAR